AKKICICHNIAPHEKVFFNKILIRRFLKKFDYFIVHGESQKEQLLKFSSKINSQDVAVTTIPTFINHFNAEKLTTKEAREKLDIQGKILLFFGFVRPYKGLSNLIYSLPIINEKYDDVILLIAGEFWWNQRKIIDNIIDELQLRNIQIVDQYIPDEEVGIYFQAADVVILPYNTGSGSGVIQTAFSYSKPVIATDVGTFSEIIKDKKIGLIIPPKNPPAIADAVIYLYEEMDRKELEKNIAKELHHFSWEKLIDVFDIFMKNNSN
ncbi:MAG: glycosyltransferase, partial [Asgard group archaeon]|nr:glycosyltransferase [Asgard group archaeon]